MFTIYAIYNKQNKKFYIGQTDDLEQRIKFHNEKMFKGYTSRFDGSWELIYSETVSTRPEALLREKQLKSFRGREFIKKQIPW
ncbi:MAG: GIY-YIG nuclease family protein [bacterium]|nr:GIY-YIG nuclease family protein [bacterium]